MKSPSLTGWPTIRRCKMDALLRRRFMISAGGSGPTPPAPTNLAGSVDSWVYHKGSSGSVSQWDTRGYGVLRCGTLADVNNYAVYTFDCATTLWSAVQGKTLKVRIKTSSITDGQFTMGIYRNAQLTAMASADVLRAGLGNLTLAADGYYEQTFVCDLSNFTIGTLTPGSGATFGINCFSRSRNNYEQIWDVQIYEVI